MLKRIISEINKQRNPKRAKLLQGFFKTGKGEYGHGDIFLGLMVPQQRIIAKKYLYMNYKDLRTLLNNKIHEFRLIALLILVERYKKTKSEEEKKKIYDFYIKNVNGVNNWDLVDLSAHKIIGAYLKENNTKKNKEILYRLARSKDLWEKRISIISCFAFIDNNDYEDAIRISKILLNDDHDLIHKAVGWVLREIGKKDLKTEEKFLDKYHKIMPRTMLRYSIEKFSGKKREYYMKK